MSHREPLKLNNGATIPAIGVGTWMAEPGEVGNAIKAAVKIGYRHIDCAFQYENQEEVGEALNAVIPSVVQREDLFITSKLWNTSHRPDLVEKELDETLRQLGTPYLDLFLMHFPVAFVPGKGLMPEQGDRIELDTQISVVDTWKAMIRLPKSKVRAIGVSNFTVEYLNGIIDATGIVPAVNQIEIHPQNPQDEMIRFCKSRGIHITAYSPLGHSMKNKPLLTEHPKVQEIAKKYSANETQVLIAWARARDCSTIPKSTSEEHLQTNFQEIVLSAEDVDNIAEIGRQDRARFGIPYTFTPKWDINIFNEPEERQAHHQVKVF